MLDGAGAFERDLSDGLTTTERAVLSRWDAGATRDTIARELGMASYIVRDIVKIYDDRLDPDPRPSLVAANAAHVAAVERVRMNAPQPRLIEVGEIEAMLVGRVDSLVSELLPNARKEGHEMCVGSLAGEPGQSLRVHVGPGPKRGWWRDFSSQESGDCLWLIAHTLFRGDIKPAVAWAKSWLHLDDADPARLEQHRLQARAQAKKRNDEAEAEKQKRMRSAVKRWHEASPLRPGDLADRYLSGRRIDLSAMRKAPGALRLHEGLPYGFKGPVVPALVGMVTRLDGAHCATHRTWLDPVRATKAGADLIGWFDEAKGEPNDPKKVMGSPLGGHIPLWKGTSNAPLREVPAGTNVYVSEGIEDGLTVACADPSLRVISMVALGYLQAMELPEQMGALVIIKQNDPPGSKAAEALARAVTHHRAQGRRVLFVEPPAGVKDLNDLARGG